MSVIDVEHLTKDYGSGRGVFDVTMHIEAGEVFGFLGPNGAGKSTTIRHLMGFSKPQSGTTRILGKDSFRQYSEILGDVGYIPGEIALPAGLTGWEFIRMMQSLYGIRDDETLEKMLTLFRLENNVLAGDTRHMSLGVKRKLAIVTAFMSDPKVLILDEPTSGLDPVMQQRFISFIKEEKARGKTVLLSSHIFSEVDATCDRIAIIKDGRIVSEFVADALRHATLKQYRVTFASPEEYRRFRACVDPALMTVVREHESKNRLVVAAEDRDINRVVEFLFGYEIEEFHNLKETLEDYFMKFYREDQQFGGIQ